MSAIEINDLKNLTVRFLKPITGILGFAGTVSAVAMAMADVSTWWLAGMAVVFTVASMAAFYLYVSKSVAFRNALIRERKLVGVFERTHTTWHAYKRLNDSLHEGIETDSAVLKVHRDILNMVSQFRDALTDLHTGETFRISIKGIVYKNFSTLDAANASSYMDEPFHIIDLPLFRDTEEGASRREDIVHDLDFDPATNPGGISALKATLFWQSFSQKKVVFVDKFDDIQQSFTKKFRSGLVAPVILHGIPFALICVGSRNPDVFCQEDEGIVCTFADALAEYIRFERILTAMQKSRKVVIMEDVAGVLDAVGREVSRINSRAEPKRVKETEEK